MRATGLARRDTLPATLTIANGQKHTAETILRAWLAGKSAHTVRAYQHDLEAFAQFFSLALGIRPSMRTGPALERFFRQSAPSAHEITLAFRDFLARATLASASINRHMATLRSMTKLARMLGVTTWALEISGVTRERRRQTAGPSVDVVKAMLAATSGDTEAATRDAAIVLTFVVLGLRVSELCGLTLQDTDLESGATWIRGKGRRERELVPVPLVVVSAIRAYLTYRGAAPGPLFQTLGRRGAARDGGLETRSVLRIVRTLGQRVGHHVGCHALRHTSITQAAALGQRAGLGLEKIRAHSRHKRIETLLIYVDERERSETQRTLADLVAGSMI